MRNELGERDGKSLKSGREGNVFVMGRAEAGLCSAPAVTEAGG